MVSISVLVFSSLAGFAFAKMHFRGRNALLLLVIASLSIPMQLGVIPLYILMGKIGWNGDLKAVIVPFLVSAFGVFYMRQAISEAVPDELLDAGRIDGCGTLRLWANVVVPAVRPTAAVLGLFTFMMTWNDFLWPLVTLTRRTPPSRSRWPRWRRATTRTTRSYSPAPRSPRCRCSCCFSSPAGRLIAGIMEGAVKG